MTQPNFSDMTLQQLAIRQAAIDADLGGVFAPVPLGEYGSLTLAAFQSLIAQAIAAGLLIFYELDGLTAYELTPTAVSLNGPSVQVSFQGGENDVSPTEM